MEVLTGCRTGIYKKENSVMRPLHSWSESVHKLLIHLRIAGFTEGPAFIGIDGNKEIVSYVDGDTYDYPLVDMIGSDSALISAAKLLRHYHDTSALFVKEYDCREMAWMFPHREPVEVICHGDFTPYNVALRDDEVVGVFDFDVAHPAPRVWDLAFSTYTWAPFMTDPGCKRGDLSEQTRRARLFCDSYGADEKHRKSLVSVAVERLEMVVSFMLEQADKGDVKFAQDVADGHHLGYQNDIVYLKLHEAEITKALLT